MQTMRDVPVVQEPVCLSETHGSPLQLCTVNSHRGLLLGIWDQTDLLRLDQDAEVCKMKHPKYNRTILLLTSKPNCWLTTARVPPLRAVH